MPPLITSLPWLNQGDPVEAYQRSQQLVMQMENQRAQQAQQQAELSQRAQEAAMQAGFQQRALALKEQEARSAVQVEADRLRQRQQGLEFEQQQEALKQQALNAPPEVVNLPGMPAAIQYRGRVQFPPRMPDVSEVGRAVPVYEGNDPTGRVLGHVARTSERGGAFIPTPKADDTADKAQAALEREARRLDQNVLLQERKELADTINKPGQWDELDPAARTNVLQRFSDIQNRLNTYRTPPARTAAPKAVSKNEQRAALANQLESENPGWTQAQVMAETMRQIR